MVFLVLISLRMAVKIFSNLIVLTLSLKSKLLLGEYSGLA